MTLQEKITHWYQVRDEAEANRITAARNKQSMAADYWETRRLGAQECIDALLEEVGK